MFELLSEMLLEPEPPSKKAKTSQFVIEAVVSDEVRDAVPLVPVLTATLKNKKMTSGLVKKLNEHFPIGELSHLKRANSRTVGSVSVISVILWRTEECGETVSRHSLEIAEKLRAIDIDWSEAIEDELTICKVAAFQPITTAQFQHLRSQQDYWYDQVIQRFTEVNLLSI